MRIGIDIDGVVTNTFHGVLKRFNLRYGTALAIEDIITYNFLEAVEVGTLEERLAFLMEMYSHEDILVNAATPIDGAPDVIRRLAEEGHNLAFVTTREPYLRTKTIEWLGLHGFPASEVNVHLRQETGEDGLEFKTRKAQELSLELFIEDDKRVAERLTIPTILIDNPWNRGTNGANIFRAASWKEVHSLISQLHQSGVQNLDKRPGQTRQSIEVK